MHCALLCGLAALLTPGGPCVPGRAVDTAGTGKSLLAITNPPSSACMVAFKIKTTCPSRYLVKPPSHILRCGESIRVVGTSPVRGCGG